MSKASTYRLGADVPEAEALHDSQGRVVDEAYVRTVILPGDAEAKAWQSILDHYGSESRTPDMVSWIMKGWGGL